MGWAATLRAKVILAVSVAALTLVALAALPAEHWGSTAPGTGWVAGEAERAATGATDFTGVDGRAEREATGGSAVPEKADRELEHGPSIPGGGAPQEKPVSGGSGGEGGGSGAGQGQGWAVAEVELGGGLVLRLEAPANVRIGQQLEAVVVLENRGSGPVTLRFATSQRFELLLIDGSGRVVRRWSEGTFFLQAIQTVTLGPGQELRETLRVGTDGLTAGSYRLVAQTTAMPTGDEVPFPVPGRTVPGRVWGRAASVEVVLVG